MKQLISFFLCKEKKYSGRKIIIQKEEYNPEKEIIIIFISGRIFSKPVVFRLNQIIEFSNITPCISFNMLKEIQRTGQNLFDISFTNSFLKNSILHQNFIILQYLYQNRYQYNRNIIYQSQTPTKTVFASEVNRKLMELYNHCCIMYCDLNEISVYSNLFRLQPDQYYEDFNSIFKRINISPDQIRIIKQKLSGGKKKSLSECTVKELRSKMKKRKLICSKDGKKLTKSQMIQKLRK